MNIKAKPARHNYICQNAKNALKAALESLLLPFTPRTL